MPYEKKELIKKFILAICILYIFLLSIKLMGISFKLFSNGFAERLISLITNPFCGLFIGILATSIVQSSSATTSLVVVLTASGLLSITNAIPIIMGANIGTSITNSIVSLGHIDKKQEFRNAFAAATVHDFFNFIVVIILFPIEIYFHILEKTALFLTQFLLGPNMHIGFSNPVNYIIQPATHFIQNVFFNNSMFILVLSLTMLFFSLRCFVKILKEFCKCEFKHLLHKHIFKNPFRSFSAGLFLTAFVQSSSITTSLIVPLVGVGILTLEAIFPYVLGANIGTTITALLASTVVGTQAAISIAIAHLLFNIIGTIIIFPIKSIPIGLSKQLANLSIKSKIYSLAYIVCSFYILPLLIIFFLN